MEKTLDPFINKPIHLQINENKLYGDEDRSRAPFEALHTKLQMVQKDNSVSILRLKDAKDHVEEMEKMLKLLEEVHVTKRCGDQMLQKSGEEVLILNRKVKSLEKCFNECHRPVHCLHICNMKKTNDEGRRPDEREFKKKIEIGHNKEYHLVFNEHPPNDIHMKVKALRGQITTSSEQIHRAEKDKTCLQADQSTQELLADSTGELVLEQQHLGSMGEVVHYPHNCHQEDFFNDQLTLLKMEIVHLKVELDHHKQSLATLEQEKCKLQASETEPVCRVHGEILAKQQLTLNLEQQGVQLPMLTEEHKELQLLYSCKIKESEGVVLQLQSHLKHVQAELDQVKCTLRTLREKEDQGFQVVHSMQKEISSRRRQIECLKSKIQHLEVTNEKLCQETIYQNLEKEHQYQELTLVLTEKKQLTKELQAEKSENNNLREQISQLEAVIYQMSKNVAGCQEFIQLQQQEYYRLKLNHILDSKKARPSVFGDQHRDISKKQRPHTNNAASGVCRRRPALERVQSTALSSKKTEAIGGNPRRRKHTGSKSHLKANKRQTICTEPFTSTPASTMTSPQLLGRRSPVHTLLTSNPNA